MKKYSLEKYLLDPGQKIAKRIVYTDDNVLAFVLNIASEESLPKHTHFDSTVLLQVLSGKGNVVVDGKTVSVVENDLVQLDGPEEMSVDNTGDKTLSLYVSISPIPPSDKYTVDVDF
ncbi:cupin domain-containing protein [Natronospora cellulosivora (SeqCode)]